MNQAEAELRTIFYEHKNKRICVLGTTCCGKSTMRQRFPESVDMDDVLWPTLTKEEEARICQKPWTSEIGAFTSKLVKERMAIQPGHPLFSLILLECDVIVYLNLSDDLLAKRCKSRNASFTDAKRVKLAIENTIAKKRMEDPSIALYEIAMGE